MQTIVWSQRNCSVANRIAQKLFSYLSYLTEQQVERAVLKRTINFVFAKDKKMYDVSTVKHRTMRCAC